MVEPILYASLGALIATLLGLMFLPFFWRRAVRLTTRQLVNRLPVSASEIVAAQDRLRAEQAMAMRSVERRAERAMSEATRDRIELARARSTELQHLADLSDLRARIVALESEGALIRSERDRHGAEAASAYDALAVARSAAEAAARDMQAARQEASAARSDAEAARNEASTRQSEIAALRQRLEAAEAARPAAAAVAPASGLRPPTAAPVLAPEAAGGLDLAALRARLDEVADAIVMAAAPAQKGSPAQIRHGKASRLAKAVPATQLNESG